MVDCLDITLLGVPEVCLFEVFRSSVLSLDGERCSMSMLCDCRTDEGSPSVDDILSVGNIGVCSSDASTTNMEEPSLTIDKTGDILRCTGVLGDSSSLWDSL